MTMIHRERGLQTLPCTIIYSRSFLCYQSLDIHHSRAALGIILAKKPFNVFGPHADPALAWVVVSNDTNDDGSLGIRRSCLIAIKRYIPLLIIDKFPESRLYHDSQ
jgi:hypothetical protein